MTQMTTTTFATEQDGFAARNYVGGPSVHRLIDALVYEKTDDGFGYFHTQDGKFASVYRLRGTDTSCLSRQDLDYISANFQKVLAEIPYSSDGQVIRITHRDIRGHLNAFRKGNIEHPFGQDIIDSVIRRQLTASSSGNGFFQDITADMIEKAEEVEFDKLNEEERDDQAERVNLRVCEGTYPYVTEILMIFYWTPPKSLALTATEKAKGILSSFGLGNASYARTKYNKWMNEFREYSDDIFQHLHASGFSPARLTGQNVLDILFRLFNPQRAYNTRSPKYVKTRTMAEILAYPDMVEVDKIGKQVAYTPVVTKPDGLEFQIDSDNKYYMKATSMLTCPGRTMPGMMEAALKRVEGEGMVSINFHVTSKMKVNARLLARNQLLGAKGRIMGKDNEIYKRQVGDLEYVKLATSSENQTNRQKLMDASVHCIFGGFDEEAVKNRAKQAEKGLFDRGYHEIVRADAIIHHSLPLNYRESARSLLKRDTPYLSTNVADMSPLYHSYQGVESPAIMVNNRDGTPIFLDIYGSQVKTAHSLVVGSTGTGKSFAFNNLLMILMAKYKPKIWLIDKGRSYESLCYAMDGSYIDLVVTEEDGIKPTCINPFYVQPGEHNSRVMPSKDEMFFMVSLLASIYRASGSNEGLGPKKNNLLYFALESYYQKWAAIDEPYEEPQFTPFIEELKRHKNSEVTGVEMAEDLSLYYGSGPFSALFDGKLDVNWEADLIVLETERMASSPALSVVMLALFRQIELYSKYRLPKNRRKICAVDEAWAVLSNPDAASALAGFYREMRKYKCGVFLISQRVADFVSILISEAAASGGGNGQAQGGILENTSHFFLLSCSNSDYEAAEKHLGFTPNEIACWQSVASLPPFFSEVFYRQRLKDDSYYSGVFRIYSSPIPLWIATSDGDDQHMRSTLIGKYLEKNMSKTDARRKAIRELADKFPYGSRYRVKEAA